MNAYYYKFRIRPIGDRGAGGHLVWFPDLPGVDAVGTDVAEVVGRAYDRAGEWLSRALKGGYSISSPP